MKTFIPRRLANRGLRTAPAIWCVPLFLLGCTTEPHEDARPATDMLGASRAPAGEEVEQQPRAALEAALRESAAAYAADFGVSEDSAIARLQQQQALQGTLSAIEEELGEDYAGSYIEHTPRLRAVGDSTHHRGARKPGPRRPGARAWERQEGSHPRTSRSVRRSNDLGA
jgi:hypothetical protein